VGKYNYYGVQGDNAWHMNSDYRPNYLRWFHQSIITESDIVWCQGSRGGVKLVHHNFWTTGQHKKLRYVTQDDIEMREFLWVKLRARTIN
jgi:hypothetical protein